MRFLTVCAFALLLSRLATPGLAGPADTTNLLVEITWGHRSAQVQSFNVKLAGRELALVDTRLTQGEATDVLQDGVARTSAGAGDVDRLSCTLLFAPKTVEPITNAHSIWKHLWKHGDAGAAQRLQADPAYRPDSRKLTVQLDEAGTRGFSLTVDQLLTQKTFWLPELDVFVSAGEPSVSFAAHQQALEARRGQRVLDRVAREPEATYAQYTARWEDMGSPAYHNPARPSRPVTSSASPGTARSTSSAWTVSPQSATITASSNAFLSRSISATRDRILPKPGKDSD